MNDDMPWVNLTQEEVEELRSKKQELTQYGKEKIRELMNDGKLRFYDKGKEVLTIDDSSWGKTQTPEMKLEVKEMMHEDIPWTQYSIDDAERMKHPEQNPDEIVLEDVKMFHLESMNERSLWVGVYTQDGKIYHLNISAVGDKLSYWWSDETCD